jgi:hypothetical protein
MRSHVWGASRAADRIWAQVSGLPPEKARKRIFVVLQAFIDDSFEEDGVFVLGGYISTAEAWAAFSKEWEKLLPLGTLNKHRRYHFKMREMAREPARIARVPLFLKVIEDHALVYVSAKINIAELRSARSRIVVPNINIDWGVFANPYFVAFRCLMDNLHASRPRMGHVLPLSDKIDFYFDNRTDKKAIVTMWDDYVARRRDEVRRYFGANPRFEDDEEFLPLQAADFWAWWVRKWYLEGTPEKIPRWDFGSFTKSPGKEFLGIEIAFNQERLIDALKGLVREHIPPEAPIYVMGGRGK